MASPFVSPTVLASDNRCRIVLVPHEVLTEDVTASVFAERLIDVMVQKSDAARIFGMTLVPLAEREIYDEAIAQVMTVMKSNATGDVDFQILDHDNATIAFTVHVSADAERSQDAPKGAFSFRSIRHIRVLRLGKEPRL